MNSSVTGAINARAGVYNGVVQHNYLLGTDQGTQELVDLDLTQLSNFNFALVGMSGTGKTYTIKRMIENFWRSRITIFAPDTQGDIGFDKGGYAEDIPREAFNECRFHYNDEIGNSCLNFMELPRGDDSAGLFGAVRDAIHTIKFFHTSLGMQQQSALASLLEETYERAGIVDSDQSTWGRTAPDVADLLETLRDRKKAAIAGLDKSIFDEVRELRRLALREKVQVDQAFERASRAQTQGSRDAAENKEKDFEESIAKLIEKTSEMIEREVRSGGPSPTANSVKLSTLETLEPVLEDIVRTKLFCGRSPMTVAPGKVNVLNLQGIDDQEMLAIYHILLGKTFSAARATCRELNPKVPRMMVVFDEAKIIQSVCNDRMSPFPRIITEGRKFGLGSLIGCQLPAQISDEIRMNISGFFQLPVVRDKQDETRRKLKLPAGLIEELVARKEALFSANCGPFKKIDMWRFD